MLCCINGCGNELNPNSKLKTCAACRQNLHSWSKRKIGEIFDRAQKLIKYRARMETFAVIKDEDVSLIDPQKLQANKIWIASVKRKAKANVVAFRLRDRKRKKT